MRRALALLSALLPLPALAQQGLQITPGVTVADVYDDDLEAAGAGPGGALISEVSPRIALGYGTERMALLVRAALDVELLDEAPVQSTPWLRWTSSAEFVSLLTDRLTLTASGSLWDTNTPRQLDLTSGFDPGQVWEESGAAKAALAFRFNAQLLGAIQGGFNSTSELGLVTNEESLQSTLVDQVSPRDDAKGELLLRHFNFGGQLEAFITAPMAGWNHRFTRNLSMELLGGPRFNGRSLEGFEGSAALGWELERAHLSFSLASTQNAVSGFSGLVDEVSASAVLVLRPAEHLRLSAAPAAYVSSGAPLTAQTFELRLDLVREVNPWVALIASYRFTAQHASFAQATEVAGSSFHNQLVFGFSFSTPAAPGLPADWPTASAWAAPGSPARP